MLHNSFFGRITIFDFNLLFLRELYNFLTVDVWCTDHLHSGMEGGNVNLAGKAYVLPDNPSRLYALVRKRCGCECMIQLSFTGRVSSDKLSTSVHKENECQR